MYVRRHGKGILLTICPWMRKHCQQVADRQTKQSSTQAWRRSTTISDAAHIGIYATYKSDPSAARYKQNRESEPRLG